MAHYLPVLAKKPHGVSHAAAIARGEPAIARYRDQFLAARPEDYRELVAILRLSEEVGLARLTDTLVVASAHHAYDNIVSVQALLAMDKPEPVPAELSPDVLQRWPPTEVAAVDAAAYGWLTEDGAGGERQ